jgi:hypothetical protein
MRGLILAIVASCAVMAFAPSSQASPLIPASGIIAVAPDDGVTQVHWRGYHHRHWGWGHRRHWGWRHHRCRRGWC